MKKLGITLILLLILLFICILINNMVLLKNYQKPSNIYIKQNNKTTKEEILLKRIYSKLNYKIDYNPNIFNYIEGDIDKFEYKDNKECYITIDKNININKYCLDENINKYIDELINTIKVN